MVDDGLPHDPAHHVERDLRTNLVRVTAPGFWTPDQLSDNMARTERVLAAVRAKGLPVRVLVDLRRSRVQSGETAERIRANSLRMYRPDDKVALVVASELARMQAKRLQAGVANRAAFLSVAEAEAWLTGSV